MNFDNRFSRLSLVAFSGLAGFVVGTLLLWLDSSLTGALPLSFGDAWVDLPMLMGGDLIFLIVWFAFWVAVGILVGIWVTHHKVHALSPALLSERTKLHRKKSFTLIELLIVIAIIAVLATVVILALNPAQLLAQSRDSNRASDMKTLNQALTLYSEDVGGDMGASSTLYISVPDPDATTSLGDACEGLGLSTSSLPSGWTYHCAGPDYYKNVDGTGWIPVDFKASSFGSPIGTLPVDPINQTSSGLYYTYAANGDPWELTALFESDKYATLMANDGGTDPAMYEVGTDLTLTPFTHGLVGYWPLDEGSGTIAYDQSGFGNDGTWYGTGVHYAPGKVGPYAGEFNGTTTDDYVAIPTLPANQFTYIAWVDSSSSYPAGTRETLIGGEDWELDSGQALRFPCYALNIPDYWCNTANGTITGDTWDFAVVTFDGSIIRQYVNGSLVYTSGQATATGSISIGESIGSWGGGAGNFFDGLIDDVRIYNRALSASEIEAIYNSEK